MDGARVDFTRIFRLEAASLGEPGRRTFRIVAESDSSRADVWLEKEHLFQLAMAIYQMSQSLREGEDAAAASHADEEREAPPLTRVEFRAGRLALKYVNSFGMFIIEAHDIESPDISEEDAPADIALWASRPRVESFAEQALELCAAGRPLCPLCGAPIEPVERGGHMCPMVNGNRSMRIPGDR